MKLHCFYCRLKAIGEHAIPGKYTNIPLKYKIIKNVIRKYKIRGLGAFKLGFIYFEALRVIDFRTHTNKQINKETGTQPTTFFNNYGYS